MASLHGFSFLTSKAQNVHYMTQMKFQISLKFIYILPLPELFMSSTLYRYDSFLWPAKPVHNMYIAMTHITVVRELHRYLKNNSFKIRGNICFRVSMADWNSGAKLYSFCSRSCHRRVFYLPILWHSRMRILHVAVAAPRSYKRSHGQNEVRLFHIPFLQCSGSRKNIWHNRH